MVKNYLRVIWRNLIAGKMYTLINVLGLAIGITAMVWAIQDIRYAYSFDTFHDASDVYRVITKVQGKDIPKAFCPLPVAVSAKNDFSSVKDYIRWEEYSTTIQMVNNPDLFSDRIQYTDPSFMKIFNFPVIKGTGDLMDKSSVLITESVAKKYFGSTDPIGQTLTIHAGEPYAKPLTVTAILRDIPANSSFQFNLLTSFENYIKPDLTPLKGDDWTWIADAVFLKIPNKEDVARLEKEFKKYIPIQNANRKDVQVTEFKFVPMAEVSRLDDVYAENNALNVRPDDSAVFGPLVLSLLILFSACLNFANTTLVRTGHRMKEMGVRKVLGGTRSQLVGQQLMETSMIVVLALLLSVLMNMWWLPTFNNMFEGIKLEANYLSDPGLIKWMLILFIAVTVIAGIYPALYASKNNITSIFRGGANQANANLFSKFLLGFQILISFITVTAGFGFARNGAFQRDYDFGHNCKNALGILIKSSEFEAFKNELQSIEGVKKVAGTNGHVGFSWRNKKVEAETIQKELPFVSIGDQYMDVMDIKLTQGRPFRENSEADYAKSVIVTESLANSFGWKSEELLSKKLTIDTSQYDVVGVCKDVYMGGFFNAPTPIVFSPSLPANYRHIVLSGQPGSLKSIHDQAKAKWMSLFPLKPFNAFYQDELEVEALRTTKSIATIFFWFAIISLILTATGMYALISLTVQKKTKELAIRKVVGASLGDISLIINKSYLYIFLLASGLGLYAGISLTKLLMDLIFKVNIGVHAGTIVNTFIAVFILVLVIISIKVYQMGQMKPSQVLKANS